MSNTFVVRGQEVAVLTSAMRHGLKPKTVHARIRRGWTPEQALGLELPPLSSRGTVTRIPKRRAPILTHIQLGDLTMPIADAAKQHGVKLSLLRERINHGWSHAQALGLERRPNPRRNASIRVKPNPNPVTEPDEIDEKTARREGDLKFQSAMIGAGYTQSISRTPGTEKPRIMSRYTEALQHSNTTYPATFEF